MIFYWVDSLIEPIYEEDEIVGYSAIRHDITSKKEVEELSINLEKKSRRANGRVRRSKTLC